MFQQIDITSIEGQYSYIGQRAYDPRLVVGILIYAYTRGVFSSRQIEKRCHEDLSFMYVSHMNCPNFRVLSDFRKDNPEFLKKCFIQSALLAKELGMVSFGHVSLDGSKFKANTSKHKAMSYDYLKLREEELVHEINELMAQAEQCDQVEDEQLQDKAGFDIPEELKIKEKRQEKIRAAKEALEKRENELNPGKKIDGKKQISFADEEARIMGKKGQYEYAYNGPISVVLGQAEVDAYVATGREDKKDVRPLEDCNREIKKPDFEYDSEKDCFICPGGQTLELKSKGDDGKRVYQATREACAQPATSRRSQEHF